MVFAFDELLLCSARSFSQCCTVEIHIELAARPPPGGESGGGPSGPRPSACNYPTGSYGARPDYQTGMCRCKVGQSVGFTHDMRLISRYIGTTICSTDGLLAEYRSYINILPRVEKVGWLPPRLPQKRKNTISLQGYHSAG